MELLATNQPWNLLFFMAIPVVAAEIIAITELYILLGGSKAHGMKSLSRVTGQLIGLYMVGIVFFMLTNAVIPLFATGGWRGWGDMVAVLGYVASAIPLMLIGALDFGWWGSTSRPREWQVRHTTCVAVFLVLAHVAMIFGMIDPTILGWVPEIVTPHDMGQMGG
jgi:membrane protease YdiL (CAAX protease family)